MPVYDVSSTSPSAVDVPDRATVLLANGGASTLGSRVPPPEPLADERSRQRADLGLLVLCGLAVTALLISPATGVRVGFALAAGLLVPGGSVVAPLRFSTLLEAIATVLGLSLAIDVAVSLATVELGWWHPTIVFAGLFGACAALLALDYARRSARVRKARSMGHSDAFGSTMLRRAAAARQDAGPGQKRGGATGPTKATPIDACAAPLLIAAGAGLWLLSLGEVRLDALGARDLAVHLPGMWYAALGLMLIGTTAEIWRERPRGWVMTAGVVAGVLILYGTVPATATAPQYAWTYKHIGVTSLIMTHGTVEPNVDLYNRWPGLFALAAAFSRITGVAPMSFAGWFEPLFTLLDAMVIAAIAHAVTNCRRTAALSALIWLITDWIGQQYFSPQGLAYPLSLVVLLVAVRHLEFEGALRPRLERWVRDVTRTTQTAQSPPVLTRWPPAVSVTMLLLIDAVIVLTHQLTPYMVVAQFAVLTALGLRPRWLVLAMAALALGYLLPNLRFLESHYGSLVGFNPFANAGAAPSAAAQLPWDYAHAGEFLTGAVAVCAVFGLVALARSGRVRAALLLGGLSLAPLALLGGSSYGGEGPLRIVLFASAPLAIAAASGLIALAARRSVVTSTLVLSAFTTLFLGAFTAYRGTNIFHAPEAQASQYFYAHAPAGSVLMLVGQNFPVNAGARYSEMGGDASAALPNVLPPNQTADHRQPPSAQAIAGRLRSHLPNAFLVFSTGETNYFRYSNLATTNQIRALERSVAASGNFSLWFANRDARIYRLVPGSRTR